MEKLQQSTYYWGNTEIMIARLRLRLTLSHKFRKMPDSYFTRFLGLRWVYGYLSVYI